MSAIGAVASVVLILLILIDAFETILLPRRVTHRFRFARFYYRTAWRIWRAKGLYIRPGKRREAFLSVFAPLSLLGLFATWAFGLIVGFASLHLSLGTELHAPEEQADFATYLYFSGTTFFTLGLGDVSPVNLLGRTLAVVQSGLGFGFLAVMIGYLPVLYQTFSRRELTISLLDARAGSPPTALQCLMRLSRGGNIDALEAHLFEWERWAAELLESHLSYPVLSFYRSQHDNQSWVTTLACILDTSALLLSETRTKHAYQAQLTFAMARHTAVDLALILKCRPIFDAPDRLPAADLQRLRAALQEAGFPLQEEPNQTRLAELRGLYEPFLHGLAARCLITLPPLANIVPTVDNWQTSAWMPKSPGLANLSGPEAVDDHFE